MQAPGSAGPPAYAPQVRPPRSQATQKIGAVLLFFAIIVAGVGGALLDYCVPDGYGFCYYPDAGAGWGLIGLGIVLLIVAIVLMVVGRVQPSPGVQPIPPGYQSQPYYPTGVPQAYPAYAPVAPPPPPPPLLLQRCGTCGQPTTFIAQYGRYYCYGCRQYT
jgi:hypothetical protein